VANDDDVVWRRSVDCCCPSSTHQLICCVQRPVIFVGVSRNVNRWVPGASNAEPSV
jgi:hypothetical protein